MTVVEKARLNKALNSIVARLTEDDRRLLFTEIEAIRAAFPVPDPLRRGRLLRAAASEKRAAEVFLVEFPGGLRPRRVVGWADLLKLVGIKESSLRVQFSVNGGVVTRGKRESVFFVTRTGEVDPDSSTDPWETFPRWSLPLRIQETLKGPTRGRG